MGPLRDCPRSSVTVAESGTWSLSGASTATGPPRLEARGHFTFTNSSTDLLCVSGPDLNACAIQVTGDVLTQFETFAGVVVRF